MHALLSASSSNRWLACTKSARFEEGYENTTSTYAAEGNAAHALAEHKLRKILGIQTKKPVSRYDSPELENYTDAYVTYACGLIASLYDPIVLIEQRLDFSNFVPEGFGTGDLIIVADGTLNIVDLKYGKGIRVSAERNTQMMLYAIGALNMFEDIKTVRMTIFQPRLNNISTFEMTADELLNWAENELKIKATIAFNGEGEFVAGSHCRFCRGKSACTNYILGGNSIMEKVTTGKVRLSYANIFEPKSINGGAEKYSVSLIIPKSDTETIAKINAAVEAAKQEGIVKLGGKIPTGLKTPMRDGDLDRADDPNYANSYFVNANSNTKPGVVDRNLQPILDTTEVYSGCYGKASITFYAYNSNGNKGIACGLQNIQKVADGDSLCGRSRAEDDFTTYDDSDFLS